MQNYSPPFEIHVHGQLTLRANVTFGQLQEALRPMWIYAGSESLIDGARSYYEDEPGIQFDTNNHTLQICWTVTGREDFHQALDEVCMSLNELVDTGAAIEVSFYDSEFDEDESSAESTSRDDFVMLFVGPNPASILRVQRDLLVQDMVNLMGRHFDESELGGVIAEVDRLFSLRSKALASSLDIGRPPGGLGGGFAGGHGGGRKPRNLH